MYNTFYIHNWIYSHLSALVKLHVYDLSLQWRHNGHDGVSNHQPRVCLLNRIFRRRSKKHQSSASLAFVWGINQWPVISPHKGPVTWKMVPFDDVIMVMLRDVAAMRKRMKENGIVNADLYTESNRYNIGQWHNTIQFIGTRTILHLCTQSEC